MLSDQDTVHHSKGQWNLMVEFYITYKVTNIFIHQDTIRLFQIP